LNQIGLWGRDVVPAPEKDFIQVGAHNRGSINPQKENCCQSQGNNKDTKATKSKKKIGKAKHSAAFHNGQNDCKESVQLAKTLQIQELMNLMKNK
jgi:hypothetical protein